MIRKIIVWTTLLALGGCAPAIPPAPVIPTLTSAPGSLPPVEVSSGGEAAADSALNGLADAAPDARDVPAFDGDEIRWDIDVRTFASHPRVQHYLNYFQGVSRTGMKVFLERGARYESMIRERFEAEGLPGDLGYLALIESGYSNDAVSRSHAVGMWQFMRGTGRGYGLRIDTWVDERRDPMKATLAAARHLRELRDRFGSLYLAAAAYNAGAGKVSRSLGKLQWESPAESEDESETDLADELEAMIEGTEPTSDAAFFRLAGTKLLAVETQDYVPKLIAAAVIAKQPERFGITPPVPTPFAYDSIVVGTTAGLDVIARLAEVSVAEIRDLNPQYLRLATPPRTESVVRLPVGTGEKVAERYAALSPSQRVRFLSHVVRRGERFTRIAARYHLSAADVQAANPRINPSHLRAGSRLVIPAVAVPSALAIRATGKAVGRGYRAGTATHRVRSGETLIGIARRYRVSLRALRRVNGIPVEYTLKAGKRLRIPS
ncbi:MAG TPA: transglycosylase SLT domain-containing protein [Gemmatimonadales bacterium]